MTPLDMLGLLRKLARPLFAIDAKDIQLMITTGFVSKEKELDEEPCLYAWAVTNASCQKFIPLECWDQRQYGHNDREDIPGLGAGYTCSSFYGMGDTIEEALGSLLDCLRVECEARTQDWARILPPRKADSDAK